MTMGTELVTADSNSAPRTLSSCLKFKVHAKVSDPAVTNSKTDEKKGNGACNRRFCSCDFQKITGSETAVELVFPLTTVHYIIENSGTGKQCHASPFICIHRK